MAKEIYVANLKKEYSTYTIYIFKYVDGFYFLKSTKYLSRDVGIVVQLNPSLVKQAVMLISSILIT